MGYNTFKNIHVCLVGDFGAHGDKVKQWTEANGGKYSKAFNGDVTHLIATKEAFRKSLTVKEARRKKGTKIVNVDWLEESLMSKTRRPKREGPYLWGKESKAAKKQQNAKNENKKARGTDPSGTIPLPKADIKNYHVYNDAMGFEYSVVLVRPTQVPNLKERYTLTIYQSYLSPHTYATHVRYTRKCHMGSDIRAPEGSTLETAVHEFTKFFRAKVGAAWEDRMSATTPRPKKVRNGDVLPECEGWFVYQPAAGDRKANIAVVIPAPETG
ncbi:hypothetical protein AJ80_06292 [Polytolypa hystricis UAMH7299]|uniref:Uncharacterized protein n=1 Tax=Polytolypa hystricis (strain UAMH7299) TaxID=1447883 RepID=A0A2B7XY42_POLH7|nr:hypothetical protein AJ80_06292 [Polytolypa hystricis UAMH7299]